MSNPIHLKSKSAFLAALVLLFAISPGQAQAQDAVKPSPLRLEQPVRGWIILSDSVPDGLAVIKAASGYQVNHLQISHEVIHDLRHVRENRRLGMARQFIAAAHAAGIQEVVLWDRALYAMNYYPDRFKTGPRGTIDLDNPEFWTWFKEDYRQMLDMVPDIQGLVLTFIETGARVENQHSIRLKTNQEKLAAVVNAVADVVIGERGLNLYTRTFSYTHEEYDNVIGAVKLFERPEIRLMMKETPHDFFLTHPNDFYAGKVARPTIIEFDVGAEFNGQGLIANAWPEHILDRAKDLLHRDHVIGYTARTDRYGTTRVIGRPSEINLYALKRHVEEKDVSAARLYDEFITARYGAAALPHVKAAFSNSFEIVTSVLYTLGTSTADHSRIDYDPYPSSYARHVTGKWLEPPVARLGHGVNQELHYWRDIIEHIAPVWAKAGGAQLHEVSWVTEKGWITQEERMNEQYLRWIVTEKDHGIRLAAESLEHIEKARPHLTREAYEDLHHYFNRTLLTARLHRAVAGAYFGFRAYARGGEHRTPFVVETVRQGLEGIQETARRIQEYPVRPAAGQWNWVEDAGRALRYHTWIVDGWPVETRGRKNPQGGQRFPLTENERAGAAN